MNRKQVAKTLQVETTDWLVVLMGSLGFSNRAIRRKTKLGDYQIYKILKKAGVKRIDYRDMTTPLAQHIGGKLDAMAERRLVLDLEKYLLKE